MVSIGCLLQQYLSLKATSTVDKFCEISKECWSGSADGRRNKGHIMSILGVMEKLYERIFNIESILSQKLVHADF